MAGDLLAGLGEGGLVSLVQGLDLHAHGDFEGVLVDGGGNEVEDEDGERRRMENRDDR